MPTPSPEFFQQAGQWCALLMLASGIFTGLAFVFKWGIRFRFVGITSLLVVLTGSLLALSFFPLSKAVIPGAAKYNLVYDLAGPQVVITVPPTITPSTLEATLLQASENLFSPGRGGSGAQQMTIKVRTILHQKSGMSQLIPLGEIQRSLTVRNDPNAKITLNEENLEALATTTFDPASS
ncbi:Ycf51 family protein [Acaryochloris sp. IP29b_bin.148]|uniref:Ycf51 family protein n=1 Tax=Acaryochloris sp. IP29b_bin.148 TaxID=2969218 RepID=UPI002606DED2|nr:Ycf51 family protein [Acaryochloris sp. IP29b_bin.148]